MTFFFVSMDFKLPPMKNLHKTVNSIV